MESKYNGISFMIHCGHYASHSFSLGAGNQFFPHHQTDQGRVGFFTFPGIGQAFGWVGREMMLKWRNLVTKNCGICPSSTGTHYGKNMMIRQEGLEEDSEVSIN